MSIYPYRPTRPARRGAAPADIDTANVCKLARTYATALQHAADSARALDAYIDENEIVDSDDVHNALNAAATRDREYADDLYSALLGMCRDASPDGGRTWRAGDVRVEYLAWCAMVNVTVEA